MRKTELHYCKGFFRENIMVLGESGKTMRESRNEQTYQNYQNESIEQWKNESENIDIEFMVSQVLSFKGSSITEDRTWLENSRTSLSEWQVAQLENVRDTASGIRCLLTSWLMTEKDLLKENYCNATWDNVYCWPPTPPGTTVNRTCIDAFTETQPLYAPHLEGISQMFYLIFIKTKGHGYRVCLADGSWLWNSWTNYTECADSYDAFVDATLKQIAEKELVTTVQYILFIGSILSLTCLTSAVTIFYYFRVLWCDRVTIHIRLMVALILRYIMLFIITEPFILKRETHYRSMDFVCKGVLIVYLYATLTSINWMFIQGIYINGKLTTDVFNTKTPFKVYYTIGWLLPFVLMSIYAVIMTFNHDVHCWSGYGQMYEIWIIICPIILALIINFMFLINILRIMLTRTSTQGPNSDAWQLIRAAKATIFLFPLLGINNLLFLYNPGGELHKYFVILNTFFGSTQGIFVAIVYCYLSRDVRAAFRRVYRRFMARRNANLIRRRANPQSRRNTGCTASSALIIEQPVNCRNSRRRAAVVIRRTQPTNYNVSYNNSQNKSQSPSSHNCSGQISNSPSQTTFCRDMLNTNNIPTLPCSPSAMSATSYTSGCRTSTSNTTLCVLEHPPVHKSYRSSGGIFSLVSPNHYWSNCDSVAAAEMLGSR